jgi:F0F1-type ATP synthase membrane subunit b/b'
MQINLTPDYSLLVILVIFLANYWVVRTFFFRPINGILNERDGEIRGAEKVYEESLALFNEAAAEMEEQLKKAKKEGGDLREKQRAEASARRGELLAVTRSKAEELIAAAETELRSEVEKAREKITRDSAALARTAAERIVGRKLA